MSKKSNKNKSKFIVIGVAVLFIALIVLAICFNNAEKIDVSNAEQIKFADMYDTGLDGKREVSSIFKNLDGMPVKLSGYMAEQSPVDESFVYLVSQPYVVCPFCTVGDITKLDVMTVMMANGSKISYTTTPVTVYGTLKVEPQVDSFGYTTQFRILAEKVEEMQDANRNTEIDNYYMQLNDIGMIFDIQTLQMTIDSIVNPDSIEMWYNTTEPVEAINLIKDDTSLDFTNYIDYFSGQGLDVASGADAYVMYIKECPNIIASVQTNNEKISSLNNELIEIYNKQIAVMEKVMPILTNIKTKDLDDNAKIEAYNSLTALCSENLSLFNQFTAWNNKLRE